MKRTWIQRMYTSNNECFTEHSFDDLTYSHSTEQTIDKEGEEQILASNPQRILQ